MFWIGLSGESVTEQKHGLNNIESDFYAVANGYVSITPIQMDATNYSILNNLQRTLSE